MQLTLAVHNLDDTVFFYRELLNQRLIRSIACGIAVADLLHDDRQVVRFISLTDFSQQHPAFHEAIDRHPLAPGLQIQLEVDNPAALKKRLDDEGVHLHYELEDRTTNRLEFWLRDLNDYLISVSGPLESSFFA